MSKTRALVVLSGGQDSTTTLVWAKNHFDEVSAVTFDYGQRHYREIEAAKKVARLVGVVNHEVVVVGSILKGRSPLTNHSEELEKYENWESMDKTIGDRVELTFVPMRNALFLTLAANYAICSDTYNIVTGVCEADNANYPDCRAGFISAQQHTTRLALGLDLSEQFNKFQIHTPLIQMSKAESIRMAAGFPFGYEILAFTHTAYDGQYPPLGKDHASVLRAHGFEEAGLPDPLVVRAWSEGLMSLPATANYEDPDFNRSLEVIINNLKGRLA